jgi:TonB family protein
MRRYLFSSALVHGALFGAFLLLSLLRSSPPPLLMVDGFDYLGSGGGGGLGGGSGPKASQIGQVVPMPVRVPIPEKPAPVQKASQAEKAWTVQEKPKPLPAPAKNPEPPVPTGEKTQSETTNIIRRGVSPETVPGQGGFDFGGGSGGGSGGGTGKGVGIGVGEGTGGGFGYGSYLKIVRERIWEEWSQSTVYGSESVCIVGMTIHSDGEVTVVSLEKASDNSFYDSVAMRAVRNASPLPPLPAGANSEQRFRIEFKLTD